MNWTSSSVHFCIKEIPVQFISVKSSVQVGSIFWVRECRDFQEKREARDKEMDTRDEYNVIKNGNENVVKFYLNFRESSPGGYVFRVLTHLPIFLHTFHH